MKRSNAIAFSTSTPELSSIPPASSSILASPLVEANLSATKKQCGTAGASGDEVETKDEDKVEPEVHIKETVGQFHDRMIPIPQLLDGKKSPWQYLWSKAEHERVFEDSEGIQFKILAARGNKYTEAILSNAGAKAGPLSFIWTVADICFKTVSEVHNYLQKRAVKVEINKHELHPWNYNRKARLAEEAELAGLSNDEKEHKDVEEERKAAEDKANAQPAPNDKELWELYVEAAKEKLDIFYNLSSTTALIMAEEMCLSDSKFLDVLDDLVRVCDEKKGVVKNDNTGRDLVLKDDAYVSMMRKEYKLVPDGLENYRPHRDNHNPDAYGVPGMRLGRRTQDSSWRNSEEAWLCRFLTCGNPLYVDRKTGYVTVSTCATGRAEKPKVSGGPFSGCVDAVYESGVMPCEQVQREAAITFSQLRTLINKLKGRVVKSKSEPTSSSSSSSSSSLSSLATTSAAQ